MGRESRHFRLGLIPILSLKNTFESNPLARVCRSKNRGQVGSEYIPIPSSPAPLIGREQMDLKDMVNNTSYFLMFYPGGRCMFSC